MSDKAIRDELDKLREQVAELHSTREQVEAHKDHQKTDSAPTNQAMPPTEELEQVSIPAENEKTQDVEQQIRDFVEALDKEIKSTNPMTVLVVFSLGVLIGRLLPR